VGSLEGDEANPPEGNLPPIQGAVVAMHTAMYRDRPDVGCVLHTHSPFATAHAVAGAPIDCWIEALAMFGLADGVPVAAYGPRGSEQAVANSRAALRPGVPAVLLANHGVLIFHRTPELAVLVGGVVEEAAQAAINARALGGPSRSRPTSGPLPCSGRWRSTPRGRRPPEVSSRVTEIQPLLGGAYPPPSRRRERRARSAPEHAWAHKPAGMTFEEAATIPQRAISPRLS
jgi:L-fuculose-phosphate aldolase